jgi:hypothetical protein
MKARSFIAVLCVLPVLAITGCSNPDGGTGGDRVSVAVDTSVPGATTLQTFTGSYPATAAAEAEAIEFIMTARASRQNNFYSLPGDARAVVPTSTTNGYGGGDFTDNYKVPGEDIYVVGYYNSAWNQSYRTEDDFEKGDTETGSGDASWATIYDDEEFTSGYPSVTYHIDGKVVQTYSYNRSLTYTNVLGANYEADYSMSGNFTTRESFSVSDETTTLKYNFEISYGGSLSGTRKNPPDPPPATTPSYDEAYVNNLFDQSGLSVSLTVWDKNGEEKINRNTANGLTDRIWFLMNPDLRDEILDALENMNI